MKEMVTTHVHIEEVVETEGHTGDFISFDRMVFLEGGRHNPANTEASAERFRTCIKMGKKYYRKSKFSKRVKWAYVQDHFSLEKHVSDTQGGRGSNSHSGRLWQPWREHWKR